MAEEEAAGPGAACAAKVAVTVHYEFLESREMINLPEEALIFSMMTL